jgi:hypothetical protein
VAGHCWLALARGTRLCGIQLAGKSLLLEIDMNTRCLFETSRTRLEDPEKGHLAVVVRAPGGRFPVLEIGNMSESGVRFSMRQPIDVATRVAIEYSDADTRIEMYGRVATCQAEQKNSLSSDLVDSYVLCIQMLSPSVLYALLTNKAPAG